MNNSFVSKLLLLSLLLLISGCSATKPGTSSGGVGKILPWSSSDLKVGYIRSDVISKRYAEYRDADNALRAENREWLEEADKMEREIADKEKEIEELNLILSEERRKDLEDENIEARKKLQKFRHETWYDENSLYMKRRKELMEPIDARVNDAIWKVAENEGLDMVFDTVAGNIVYVKPAFDITEMVLEELEE